ncbi:MAG: WYL domain-containing protein [Oscillospiraceae bacterium]|nr:WYL domain-containing protein [Oscillospiraceae bacterium]
MAYSELIKNISRIREYMREFFVYGFKNRDEVGTKSARSYDNERRRIESWLGEYMSFRQDAGGKNVFIFVDSRRVLQNPLYQAWRAAGFTRNDITLHFWLLDILSADKPKSLTDIIGIIDQDYLSLFENGDPIDESTLRKKLKEYVGIGLIAAEKQGKQLVYRLSADGIDLKSWREAIGFFAGENPVGVIGSFLQSKFDENPEYISFKHNYLLFAPDCGIMLDLLTAVNGRRQVEIETYPNKRRTVLPLKIFISTQTGRQYAAGCDTVTKRIMFFRLDAIKKIKQLDVILEYDAYAKMFAAYRKHLWGVASGEENCPEHIEMILKVETNERHIAGRLEREKRCGRVQKLSDTLWQFEADVYNAQEMLPWLRTFTGRIVSLRCTNKAVEERFYSDFAELAALYGGDDGDV